MADALIIFVRPPTAGNVKTRVAATLGNAAALFIYNKLLQHTLEITETTEGDKVVFYAGDIVKDDMWQQPKYIKLQQAGGDLGHRMNAAFETVLAMGYYKVCIVGSDCYELTPNIIADAFRALDENDIAIGPAHDGGYYLLGMKQLYTSLFQNKSWSSPTVLADTLQNIQQLGLTVEQLPQLSDVDEAEDVPAAWLTEINK